MQYKIKLVPNDQRISSINLEEWLAKYFFCAFHNDTLEGIVYNDYGLSEIKRVIPTCGYSVEVLETFQDKPHTPS